MIIYVLFYYGGLIDKIKQTSNDGNIYLLPIDSQSQQSRWQFVKTYIPD